MLAADYLEAHFRPLLGPWEEAQPLELAINDWLPAGLAVRETARTATSVTCTFVWPSDPRSLPRLPLGTPGVQLALRWPVPIARLELAGPGLKRAVVRACWPAAEEAMMKTGGWNWGVASPVGWCALCPLPGKAER